MRNEKITQRFIHNQAKQRLLRGRLEKNETNWSQSTVYKNS